MVEIESHRRQYNPMLYEVRQSISREIPAQYCSRNSSMCLRRLGETQRLLIILTSDSVLDVVDFNVEMQAVCPIFCSKRNLAALRFWTSDLGDLFLFQVFPHAVLALHRLVTASNHPDIYALSAAVDTKMGYFFPSHLSPFVILAAPS